MEVTAGKPRTILVVDDSVFSRLHTKKVLQEAGYTVAEAGNGAAALATMDSQAFDCIVTDLLMPTLDGFGLLEAVQKRHAGTPVVVLTADIQTATHARCVELGASGFVQKPINAGRLHAVLTSLLKAG
jgi:CheY-like chemotaxis protein